MFVKESRCFSRETSRCAIYYLSGKLFAVCLKVVKNKLPSFGDLLRLAALGGWNRFERKCEVRDAWPAHGEACWRVFAIACRRKWSARPWLSIVRITSYGRHRSCQRCALIVWLKLPNTARCTRVRWTKSCASVTGSRGAQWTSTLCEPSAKWMRPNWWPSMRST